MGLFGGLIGGLFGGIGKGLQSILPGLGQHTGQLQGMAGKPFSSLPMQGPSSGGLLGNLMSPNMGQPNLANNGPMPPIGRQPQAATADMGSPEMASSSIGDMAKGAAWKMSGIPKIDNIKSMIAEQVKTAGTPISPSYFDRMAQIESGYNPTAGSPTGAKGLFQFIGSTWKQFGKGDPMDPIANTQAAIKLADNNYSTLASKLGRPPTDHELYMAHNIGAGGALRLLSADPNQTVSAALIGSKPQYNPKFLMGKGGQPISARTAINNYAKAFMGKY